MTALARALSAETLKTKRTLALVLAFLTPLAMAFLELAICFQYGKRMYRVGGDAWMTLIGHTAMIWAMLMLPLFVTLQMGLLGAMEHNNRTWKQIYALPTPRWVVYLAKQIIGTGIIGLSMIVLALMTAGVGLVGRVLLPQLGFDAAIPWANLIKCFSMSFLATFLIISIHLWISMRWSSFVLAMGVGIVATVFGVVVMGTKWERFDPWTMPGVVANSIIEAEPYGILLAISVIGGILVACVGCWEATRHDVL